MREDDIFVVSFPKCGTTLTMELCWLVSKKVLTRKVVTGKVLAKKVPTKDFPR